LNLRKPQQYSKNKVAETAILYHEIVKWFGAFTISDEGKQIINLFNQKYPEAKISDTKKIDFVLWQIRE
jgi:hypothetical protein